MNFNKALIVYKKELLEMLRDKRTLFTTILLPVILYPLIFVGFSSLMSRQTVKLEQRGATIAIVDSVLNDTSKFIINQMSEIKYFSFIPYTRQIEQQFQDKTVNAIVSITDSLSADNLQVFSVNVKFDKSSDQGKLIIDKIGDSLQKSEKIIIEQELSKRGLNPQIVNIVKVKENDVSTAQKKVGMMLGMLLPYLLIILLVSGAAVVAADLVAGEKERHTLETLLVSSAHRTEIVIGKYLTIITIAMINVLVNLVSLFFSAKYMAGRSGLETSGVTFPLNSFVILFLALIPLATLFAAILLSISTFSRNMKEARSYEQPLLTVSMLLGMISFFPAFELNNLMALIPVINIALLFKAVMINEYQISHLLITIGSTLVLDAIALWTTIKLFNSESVLFRTDDDSSVKNVKKDKRAFFNSYYGFVYFVVALLALFYIGSYLQTKDLAKGLIQTQVFLILLPVLAIVSSLKMSAKETFRLHIPSIKTILPVPFIALSGAIIVSFVSQLINYVYPFPKEYLEQFSKLFNMDYPLWQQLLIIAVMPGICEEILFRGFLIRFFEGKDTKIAIIISAILFAAFHLDPFRFFPVLLLGFVLGYLTIRSGSIYVSMMHHTINNGFAVLMVWFSGTKVLSKLFDGPDNINIWVLPFALAIFSLSIIWFHCITKKKEF